MNSRVSSKRYLTARTPWEHQVEALARLRGAPAFALLMAMRTGKTKVLYDDFGRLELSGNCHDLLVCAPAGVYRTWEDAGLEHLSEDLRRRARFHVWESGAGVYKRALLESFMMHRGPRIFLVNSEATSSVKACRDAVKDFLSLRENMATYDESVSIKNPDSERAKFAVQEVKPLSNYRRILTGLPTPKSPLDAYSQFEFLDKNILNVNSFQGFRTQYCVMRKVPQGPAVRLPGGEFARNPDGSVVRREIPIVVAYRDPSSIRRKIEAYSFRKTLGECYDLPPKMYLYRDVEWHPEQKRVYDELKQFATAQLSEQEYVTVQQVVVQILRLHQVLCGHVKNEAGELREIPERRTDSLLDLLEDYDGKAVIWCSYDYNVQKLTEAISSRFAVNGNRAKVARFWGGNRRTREEEERVFREDPECRHMVATPAAARYGRYWVVADMAVFFSNNADYDHRMQAEERTQAIDKTESVGYYDMRLRGTVDDRHINTLREKRSLSDVITGDAWREWLT